MLSKCVRVFSVLSKYIELCVMSQKFLRQNTLNTVWDFFKWLPSLNTGSYPKKGGGSTIS